MKQALQNKSTRKKISVGMEYRLREGLLILSVAFAFFLLISFGSYNEADSGWSSAGLDVATLNSGGRVGAFLSDFLLSIFGYLAYILPPMIIFSAWIGVHRD
ncbi:DNA translocase FtsK 4TM domain-containing protein, partial [Gammaproteobacteria bacterium]|nr:DNA translocase FtsK 4TM domain-containing protein [Gammaproteobacteria bacterium]